MGDNLDISDVKLPPLAPKRPLKRGDRLPSKSMFSQPLFSNSAGTSNDEFHLESPEKLTAKCQICDKDLSSLTQTRRIIHVNECLNKQETVNKTEKAREKHDNTYDCPICRKPLPPGPYRISHAKTCAREHEIAGKDLVKMMGAQDKAAQVRRSKKLQHTSAPVPKVKAVKSQKLQGMPRSMEEEQMQLAQALSASCSGLGSADELTLPAPVPAVSYLRKLEDPNEKRRKRPRSFDVVELNPIKCRCKSVDVLHERFQNAFRRKTTANFDDHASQLRTITDHFTIFQTKMLEKIYRLERLSDDLAKLLASSGDFRITCSNGQVQAHKSILSVRTKIPVSSESHVLDAPVEVVNVWLRFVYCGRVEWNEDQDEAVMQLASLYGPESLKSLKNRHESLKEVGVHDGEDTEGVSTESSQSADEIDVDGQNHLDGIAVETANNEKEGSQSSDLNAPAVSLEIALNQLVEQAADKRCNSAEDLFEEDSSEQHVSAEHIESDNEDPLHGINLSSSTVDDDCMIIDNPSRPTIFDRPRSSETTSDIPPTVPLQKPATEPLLSSPYRVGTLDLFIDRKAAHADDTSDHDTRASWLLTPAHAPDVVLSSDTEEDMDNCTFKGSSRGNSRVSCSSRSQSAHIPESATRTESPLKALYIEDDPQPGVSNPSDHFPISADPVVIPDSIPNSQNLEEHERFDDFEWPHCEDPEPYIGYHQSPSPVADNRNEVKSPDSKESSKRPRFSLTVRGSPLLPSRSTIRDWNEKRADYVKRGANDDVNLDENESFGDTDALPINSPPQSPNEVKEYDSFDEPAPIRKYYRQSLADRIKNHPLATSTPIQKVPKLTFASNVKILKTAGVTPMPDYEGMTDEELKVALAGIGSRPVGRKKAVALLKQNYETTHPVIDPNTPTVRPLACRSLANIDEKEETSPKKRSPRKILKTAPQTTPKKPAPKPQISGSPVSDDDIGNKTLNDPGEEPLEETVLDDPRDVPKNIEEMRRILFAWLRKEENSELLNHMITLRPVLLNELHEKMKRADDAVCTISLKALSTILDREGITFSLPQTRGRRRMAAGGSRRNR